MFFLYGIHIDNLEKEGFVKRIHSQKEVADWHPQRLQGYRDSGKIGERKSV